MAASHFGRAAVLPATDFGVFARQRDASGDEYAEFVLFGPMVERFWGGTQFLVIYLAAILGGNLLSLLVHRHHDYRALGASGGVSGIILASVFMFPGLPINFHDDPDSDSGVAVRGRVSGGLVIWDEKSDRKRRA